MLSAVFQYAYGTCVAWSEVTSSRSRARGSVGPRAVAGNTRERSGSADLPPPSTETLEQECCVRHHHHYYTVKLTLTIIASIRNNG